MIASDTAWSESETGWPAAGHWAPGDTEWPEADAGEPVPDLAWQEPGSARPEAYRHLWQPPGRRPPPRQAIGQPYVWDGVEIALDGHGSAADVADEPRRPERQGQSHRGHAHPDALIGPALTTERAVIGDLLRELAAWCQIGACIARHTDGAALGEADIRNKAVAAGWCVDLFGRMVCPACQQRHPVWSARPPVERGRYRRMR